VLAQIKITKGKEAEMNDDKSFTMVSDSAEIFVILFGRVLKKLYQKSTG